MRKCGETERRTMLEEKSGETERRAIFFNFFSSCALRPRSLCFLLCHYREQEAGNGREYASFNHIFHKIPFDTKKRFPRSQKNIRLHQLANEMNEMLKIEVFNTVVTCFGKNVVSSWQLYIILFRMSGHQTVFQTICRGSWPTRIFYSF
jgi:hypothetical protein